MTDWSRIAQRIRSKVRPGENGCWDWTGSLDADGYARINVEGRNWRASQVSWAVHNRREWPKPLLALHSCDNRRCVNPDHLRPGTNAENMKEAWARGGKRHLKFRTHCPKGHEFTPENSLRYRNPDRRACRECVRLNSIVQNAKSKARREAARAQKERSQ